MTRSIRTRIKTSKDPILRDLNARISNRIARNFFSELRPIGGKSLDTRNIGQSPGRIPVYPEKFETLRKQIVGVISNSNLKGEQRRRILTQISINSRMIKSSIEGLNSLIGSGQISRGEANSWIRKKLESNTPFQFGPGHEVEYADKVGEKLIPFWKSKAPEAAD